MESENLAGKRFTSLTAIRRVENNKFGQVVWECKCDCGKTVLVPSGKLKSGSTKSCGCYSRNLFKERAKTHGCSGNRLYTVWAGVLRRCSNPNTKEYCRYGGRGIKVCEAWKEYANFKTWAEIQGYDADAPRGKYMVERIDNNGHYEPSNCKLATNKEQARNKRSNRIVLYNGKAMCLAEAAEQAGLPYYLVSERIIRLGWSDHAALNTPRAQRTQRYLK